MCWPGTPTSPKRWRTRFHTPLLWRLNQSVRVLTDPTWDLFLSLLPLPPPLRKDGASALVARSGTGRGSATDRLDRRPPLREKEGPWRGGKGTPNAHLIA